MRNSLLALFMVFLSSGSLLAAGEVDVQELRTVELTGKVVQTVATADGQQIYLLTENGEVQIFSANGELAGRFDAGPDVTGITPQGSNRLVLIQGDQKRMVLIGIEQIVQISEAGAPSLGPVDAPVSIVIYDDFECPYCAKAVPLLKEVVNAYPQQVKLVFKNFPLGMHRHARAAAVAGLAADKQGKFWPLHDLLFANYNKLNPKLIEELAEQAGLDMQQFNLDRANPRLQQQVNADLQEGQKVGVRGTPTIFVNGRRLPQRSRAAFDQLIQAELAKLEPAEK